MSDDSLLPLGYLDEPRPPEGGADYPGASGVVALDEIEGRQYAALTIRPRTHRRLPACLHPVAERDPQVLEESP